MAANKPDDGRLRQGGHQHLFAAGAEGPEQGQFPGPLGDQDREGVEDDERADEQRDQGEDQQERGEERRGPC